MFIMSLFAQLYATKWLLIAVVLMVYAVTTSIVRYRRLRAFPGPTSSGWCELLHTRAILSRHSHLWYKVVGDEYGEWKGGSRCPGEAPSRPCSPLAPC